MAYQKGLDVINTRSYRVSSLNDGDRITVVKQTECVLNCHLKVLESKSSI